MSVSVLAKLDLDFFVTHLKLLTEVLKIREAWIWSYAILLNNAPKNQFNVIDSVLLK